MRRSSDARISDSPRTLTRAAASSIASGSPSSRRQISDTSGAVSGESWNPGRAARARSTNRSDRHRAGGRAEVVVRHGQRREDDARLAGQPQHLPARCQDADTRAGGEDRRRDVSDVRDDPLAPVQQQHGAGVGQPGA